MILDIDFSAVAKTEIGRQFVSNDDYESEVFSLISYLLINNANIDKQLFLDIGGNIGVFPLYVKKFCSNKSINIDCIMHEPLPWLASLAEQLASSNKTNYLINQSAVADYVGVADFYVSQKSDASNSLVKGFRKAKDVIKVDVVTIDSIYLNINYNSVILMIDVETAEPQVLLGANEFIEKFRPLIICEVLAGRTEVELNLIFSSMKYIPYRYRDGIWIREERCFGDPTYVYRDWFFVPIELFSDFGDSFSPVKVIV